MDWNLTVSQKPCVWPLKTRISLKAWTPAYDTENDGTFKEESNALESYVETLGLSSFCLPLRGVLGSRISSLAVCFLDSMR